MAPRANWKGYLRLSLVSWTSRVGPKPPSIVCAVRCELRRTTPTSCSISRSCYSEARSMRRRRSTGGNISPMTLNLNGQRGRGGL
jgi:hypothetical protein